MRLITAIIFLFSQLTWGQVVNKTAEFNYVWGADYFTNWVLNPSANLNLSNTTTSNATLTRDTTTKLNNVASFNLDASATSGYAEFTLGTVVAPATAGNCEFKGVYLGDGSLYSAQVLDGSANVLSSARLQNSGSNWQAFSIYYPCAASGSRKVRITQTTAGTSPAINIGKLYYGQQTDVGAGVPNNVFSAQISSAGVVSAENQDFINGNCTNPSTGNYTCTFNTSFFSTTPTCTANTSLSGATGQSVAFTVQSSSAITMAVAQDGVTNFNKALNLTCTRSSTDWVQPTITAPNWDTDWADYTLTIGAVTTPPTQGAGAVKSAKWRRVGDTMELMFTYAQTAAGSAGSGAYKFPVPAGYTIDTSKVTVSTNAVGAGGTVIGNGQLQNTSTAATNTVTIVEVIPYDTQNLVLYPHNGGQIAGPMSSSYFGLGNTTIYVTYFARVPITGWTKTLNAPLLVGSVTSNATGALRTEYARIQNNGTCTILSQSSAWISSLSHPATGQCQLTLPAGVFSDLPVCTCAPQDGVSSVSVCPPQVTSTTSILAYTAQSTSSTGFDRNFNIMCIGPR